MVFGVSEGVGGDVWLVVILVVGVGVGVGSISSVTTAGLIAVVVSGDGSMELVSVLLGSEVVGDIVVVFIFNFCD